MKKEELKQIEDYLLLYKLPLDILLEVKDHMSTQIAEIQAEKEITFENAFTETKLAWEKDLKPTKFKLLFQDEVPMIVKKLSKEKYWDLLKKSILVASISLGLNLIFVFISKDVDVFSVLFRIQNGIFVILPIIVWLSHLKMKKYMKYDFKFRGKSFYTIYQQNVGLLLTSSGLMAQVTLRDGSFLYNYLQGSEHSHLIGFLMTLFIPIVIQINVSFAIFNFINHKQTLKKIQNYIVE
ncbi:hypothetical protein [Chryseobacterium sp.]|uniref:hypothetical protein n=1 Tax=Chryseobacterium sp. TaxID=1871047 RepID=UPI00388E10D1